MGQFDDLIPRKSPFDDLIPRKSQETQRSPEKMPLLPVKEDIPGLQASALSGATLGISNIGEEPKSKALAGYPGEMIQRGVLAAKKFPEIANAYAFGGGISGGRKLYDTPIETISDAYGISVPPKPVSLSGKVIGAGIDIGTGALMGRFGGSALQRLGQGANKTALRIADQIIHPTGKLAKRAKNISKTSLETGSLRSTAERTAEVGQRKIHDLMNDVEQISDAMTSGNLTAKGALKRVDALARWYKSRGDSASAEKILSVKKDIISGEKLMKPVLKEVEEGGFVMGNASKQVSPQITKTLGENIPDQYKTKARYESVRLKGGKFGRSEPKREILTHKKYVERPEDIVAMNDPGAAGARPRKITTISPKETYELRPMYRGVGKKSIKAIGEEPRKMTVKQINQKRRGQDALLKRKKEGGGYLSDVNSSEIQARKEFAGGLRREIGKASPEIAEKNRLISQLIDLVTASEKRAPVASRNNFMGLVNSGLVSGSIADKRLLIPALGRMAWGFGKSAAAKKLYGFGKSTKNIDPKKIQNAIAILRSGELTN